LARANRVYYRQRGEVLVLILCGGDKSSQAKDILRAKEIFEKWEKQSDGN
jgi:putative addiction module killer protein